MQTDMTNRQAIGACGKTLAVMFCFAFSLTFAQEIGSTIVNGCISLVLFLATFFVFRAFEQTEHRFLIAVSAIAAATFLVFCINNTLPGTAFANIAGLVLFVLLIALVIYAFMRPSGSGEY